MYAGMVNPDGMLDLQARNHPGLAAVSVAAMVSDERVEVATANSAVKVLTAKVPQKA